VGANFDLVIATNNEADVGRPGIQYVHFPRLEPIRAIHERRWYHWPSGLVAAYRAACNRLARYSPERMTANLTLTNSAWIADRVRALHGVPTTVLYPPVPGVFPPVPWVEREDRFVAIGRWSPEKRFGRIIDTIAAVRRAGQPVRLDIIGTPGPPDYTRAIRRRAAENAEWLSLHENLDRPTLLQRVARARYGIHQMPDEHFGIAVAEMVRAGCITFVPSDGGPAEIVGRHPPLLFASPQEATAKILAALTDQRLRTALRAHLAERAHVFSCERFVAQFRAIVNGFPAAT
jgi:glycosyltransferase involved in cell wall biosynthesis